MKKILLILLLMISAAILPSNCFAQDKIDKLSDKVDKLTDKIDKLVEQQAITATKVDGLEKSVDKRFDSIDKRLETQTAFIGYTMGLVGILIAAMLGFISYVFWDRQTGLKPIEASNATLVKEIALLKEKEAQLEAKLQEKQLKDDSIFKKLFEKFPDLANIT